MRVLRAKAHDYFGWGDVGWWVLNLGWGDMIGGWVA